MKRQRGFTLVELILAMFVMGWVIVGTFAVFKMTLDSYYGTRADIEMTDDNALAIRRVVDSMRGAFGVTVVNNGLTVQYSMPLLNGTVDATTGEFEIVHPVQSDGTIQSYSVVNGQLVRDQDGYVLADNVVLTDPDPSSSGFNTAYVPFELTTIGSMDALKINLITEETVAGEPRYVRMKTTVLIRNSS